MELLTPLVVFSWHILNASISYLSMSFALYEKWLQILKVSLFFKINLVFKHLVSVWNVRIFYLARYNKNAEKYNACIFDFLYSVCFRDKPSDFKIISTNVSDHFCYRNCFLKLYEKQFRRYGLYIWYTVKQIHKLLVSKNTKHFRSKCLKRGYVPFFDFHWN